MRKILFYLRRLHLRFYAGYPKHLSEKQIQELGQRIWREYCRSHDTDKTSKCLWEFQSFALTLDFKRLFALQEFLCQYQNYCTNNFSELHSLTDYKAEKAYKEKINAYYTAIR